jgi:hypothetical protein
MRKLSHKRAIAFGLDSTQSNTGAAIMALKLSTYAQNALDVVGRALAYGTACLVIAVPIIFMQFLGIERLYVKSIWFRDNAENVAAICSGLALLSGLFVILALRRKISRQVAIIPLLLNILVIAFMWLLPT